MPLVARGAVIGVLQLLNPVGRERFTDEDLRRMELFAGLLAHPLQNARLYAAQRRQFLDMVTALAETSRSGTPTPAATCAGWSAYSVLLGAEMGLDREELEELWLAATLHDIGKIAVPDRILGKPAPLDAEEAEVMKRHPVDRRRDRLAACATPAVLPGVRSHHERMDGQGYPDGLAGRRDPAGRHASSPWPTPSTP